MLRYFPRRHSRATSLQRLASFSSALSLDSEFNTNAIVILSINGESRHNDRTVTIMKRGG